MKIPRKMNMKNFNALIIIILFTTQQIKLKYLQFLYIYLDFYKVSMHLQTFYLKWFHDFRDLLIQKLILGVS